MPENLAAQRQNKKIEDLLYDDARRKKEKQAELEKQQTTKQQPAHLKISDKYILSKFQKQFKTAEQMNGHSVNEEENGQGMATIRDTKLNYLQFKDFMINFGLLTREQAHVNCIENLLIFDMWEIIAPKVERDLTGIDKEDDNVVDDCDVT